MIYTDGVHLITDNPASYDELHAFAAQIGLRRSWFQGDHHDLTTRKKAAEAVAAGAVLIDVMDLGRLSLRIKRALAISAGRTPKLFATDPPAWLVDPHWKPAPLDPALAADKNTELMRRFAPGRRIGRRGGDHL